MNRTSLSRCPGRSHRRIHGRPRKGPLPRFAPLVAVAVIAMSGPALSDGPRTVTLQGKTLTLAGKGVQVGEPAPGFTVLDGEFQPVSLSEFRGRIVLISAVPSLDTRVCTLQTKRFDEAIADLPKNVVVMTISMDLPFAQKQFCGKEDIKDMVVVSDSARREFGNAYGVLIPERGLLARSVFVIDPGGVLRYQQIVPEMTHEPDYDAALAAVRSLAH
jgi:thiol peroxidase